MGIFVSDRKYRNLLRGNRHCFNQFFDEEASANNLLLYYLPLYSSVEIGDRYSKALIFCEEKGRYVEEVIPIPPVIYNRVSLKAKKNRKKIERLLDQGYHIFNAIPFKNGKWTMHQLLEKSKDIKEHLPQSLEATEENIISMMEQFEFLFIKPFFASIGKGIMYIEKQENESWIFHYRDENGKWQQEAFTTQLPSHLLTCISSRPFIVQERIQLATYQNRTFDTRVIVQKNETGCWGITGMLGKLAQHGDVITNVGQGGDFADIIVYLQGNPTFNPEEVYNKIKDLAINIANYLEAYTHHIADLGMDIGITKNGKPYFIECNFRSQYSGLEQEYTLIEVCRNIFANPIRYGNYLLSKS